MFQKRLNNGGYTMLVVGCFLPCVSKLRPHFAVDRVCYLLYNKNTYYIVKT
jgi:hypothetical protein